MIPKKLHTKWILALVVLGIFGILAGIILIRQTQDPRGRAIAPPGDSCIPVIGRCIVDIDANNFTPFKLVVQTKNGLFVTDKTVISPPAAGESQSVSLAFGAVSGQRYVCRIEAVGTTCTPKEVSKDVPFCVKITGTPPPSATPSPTEAITPTRTPTITPTESPAATPTNPVTTATPTPNLHSCPIIRNVEPILCPIDEITEECLR